MIYITDMETKSKLMNPVTTSDYITGKGVNFHPEGLFSETIFGAKDAKERRSTYSFIDLHCKIIHPALIKPIWILNRKVIDAFDRTSAYSFNEKGLLVPDINGDINGASAVIEHFKKMMNRTETDQKRLDMQNMVHTYMQKNMLFIDKCIVMPAFYRDAELDEVRGGLRVHPINDYYVSIIRQSIQLESMSMDEGPMYDILTAKMQSLVNDLYNYLIKKTSKKEGLVRKNILGKRLDFSGGAVITGASTEIKVNEIGVPFKMLVKLFEPAVIYDIHNSGNVDNAKFSELLREFNGDTFSIPSTKRLLTSIHKGFEVPLELENMVRVSVERAITDKVVIAKRDPALHAESVQGFIPKMVEGNTIKLNILKCSAYNADFDGDRMALFVPITKQAIQETKDKLISSDSRDSITSISDEFGKDIVIGLYCLTQDNPSEKAPIVIRDDVELDKLHPNEIIKYDTRVTTVGRVIFNKILPSKKYYIDEAVNKKTINALAAAIHNDYADTPEVYIDFAHQAVVLGSKYSTIMSPSFSLSDFDIPKSILKLKEDLADAESPAEASKITDIMTSELAKYVEKQHSNIGIIGEAGGLKGGYNQARQILISKGLISDPEGGVRVIKHSYGEGFESDEFFESGFGSRKGVIDRVINTAETGYMSRQLIYALQRVEADPKVRDCKTKRFMTLKVTKDLASRLVGRYIVNDDGELESFNIKKHMGKVIHLRTPLYCISNSLCNVCYGDMLIRNKTRYVGILAAEVCGERLTQTIMRTFHTGGAVSIKTVDILDEISRILDSGVKVILNKNFKQEKSQLISLTSGHLDIKLSDYLDPKKDITTTEKKIDLKYAYCKLTFAGIDVDVTIDNAIEIDLSDKEFKEFDGIIRVKFRPNSTVFNCIPTNEAMSEKIKIIKALLSGKTPYKNADHFFMKIYDQYVTLNTNSDLIHLEVLASNLLRDRGNPCYPARLNPNYDGVALPLKSISKLESWLQAFAFEDPKAAITTGLLYDRPVDETILEKLITGKF